MNKLVPCAWLSSGALEVWRLRLRLRLRVCLRVRGQPQRRYHGVWKKYGMKEQIYHPVFESDEICGYVRPSIFLPGFGQVFPGVIICPSNVVKCPCPPQRAFDRPRISTPTLSSSQHNTWVLPSWSNEAYFEYSTCQSESFPVVEVHHPLSHYCSLGLFFQAPTFRPCPGYPTEDADLVLPSDVRLLCCPDYTIYMTLFGMMSW